MGTEHHGEIRFSNQNLRMFVATEAVKFSGKVYDFPLGDSGIKELLISGILGHHAEYSCALNANN